MRVDGATATPSSPGYALALLDPGAGSVAVSVVVATTAPEYWLVLRASDGANYWRFGRRNHGAYELQQIVGNAYGSPTITPGASVSGAAGDLLSCRVTTTQLRCAVDDVVVATTSGPFNQAATKVGLAAWESSGVSPARWDELTVTDLGAAPDLTVALEDADPVVAGGQLRWTATVTNVGQGPATAVALSAAVPDGVTAPAATSDRGHCETAAFACSLGELEPGASASVLLTGTAPSQPGTVVLDVAATTDGEAHPADNAATASTRLVAPSPEGVRVADTFDRGTAATLGAADTGQPWAQVHGSFGTNAGAAVARVTGYSLATLDGGAASGRVSVRVAEPSTEFWLLVRVVDGGSYWRFGRSGGGAYQLQQIDGGALGHPQVTIRASVSAAPGDVVECRFEAETIDCLVGGVVVASATAVDDTTAHGVGLAAWDPGGLPTVRFDELVVADLPVAPDLMVSLDDDDPALVGSTLRWTATASNVGNAPAAAVELALVLPVGVTASAVEPDGGSCTGTTTVSCTVEVLAPGEALAVVVRAGAPATPATLHATASASIGPGPAQPDDVVEETTTVRNPPAAGDRVVDAFDRSGSALGSADSGEPWLGDAGAFAVADGQARATTAAPRAVWLDAGWSFGTYELTVDAVGDRRFWLLFRVVDADDHYRVGPDPTTGYYRVDKVVHGQVQPVAIAFARSHVIAADGDLIRVVTRPDDSIFVSVNGVHLVDAGDVAGMHATAFGFATASTSTRVGHLDVSQVLSAVVTVGDTFSRPDGASVDYLEYGVHYPWWYGASWRVDAGQAFNPGGYSYTAVDTSSEAGDVQVRVTRAGGEFGLVIRYAEDGSYVRVGRLVADGPYGVDLVRGYEATALAGPVEVLAQPTPADGDVLLVRQGLDGRVELSVNGQPVLRFTDPTNLRSTHYGLFASDGSSRFDDFSVVPE